MSDDLTPEEAAALVVRAMATDLEGWATNAADYAGRIGVVDLIRSWICSAAMPH